MTIQMIPLDQLVPSRANARKTGVKIGIAELAASIIAHGLLQNLQVRPNANGKFEVVAGSRRLAALRLLAKQETLPTDAPIACNVLDTEHDREISLAENEMRLAMHPADQFDAFKALTDAGQGVEAIAARFGVSPIVVRQRLKLATVSPRLLALYRKDDMTLDHLMAFTVSDDHHTQEAAWSDTPSWNRNPSVIRRTLTAAHVEATDRRAQFVGIDAYVAAGGAVVTDLFQEQGEGYLTDPALLDRLVNERLEREADAIRQEGWGWVEIVPDLAYDILHRYGRTHGMPQPLPAKQAKALAKAEKALDALREIEELTDEEADRFDALENEIGTLSEPQYLWSVRQMAQSGAFVSIDHDGALDVTRGLIRPADIKAAQKDDRTDAGAPTVPTPAGLSATLTEDLTAHRTAALRALLAETPDVALAAATHALAVPLFYGSRAADTGLAFHAASPFLRAEGIDACPAAKRLAERQAAWVAQLPEDAASLWDWLRAQEPATVASLMAFCVAAAVEPVRNAQTDRLAMALSLDMTQWWQPTAAGYFGRVSKTLIGKAVTEAVGAHAAHNIASLKKDRMATTAERLLTGTGWLPDLLRVA